MELPKNKEYESILDYMKAERTYSLFYDCMCLRDKLLLSDAKIDIAYMDNTFGIVPDIEEEVCKYKADWNELLKVIRKLRTDTSTELDIQTNFSKRITECILLNNKEGAFELVIKQIRILNKQ